MDLMPWGFSLFEDIENRAKKGAPKGRETVPAFKNRLRLVALRTPAATVEKAFADFKPRAKQVIAATSAGGRASG